jgi:hypothetical protein
MVIQEAHDYFDLLCDKIESPYFSPEEKDILITQACIEFVKQLFPSNEGGVINVEIDQTTYSNIHSLVYGINVAYANNVALSTIQTALNSASASTEPWMYILNVSLASGGVTYPVKYSKQNNHFANERNYFKKGSVEQPTYRLDSQYFRFSPSQILSGTPLGFTLIKQPKAVSLDDGVDIELPEHCHKTIVEMAVNLASISIREPELRQLNNG